MEKVKAQGVLVATVLLALTALPGVARAVAGGPTFPANAHAATHCDCETR